MSLPEACLAVAIILAITMIAVPPLIRSQDDYLLAATARQIASHLHSTRIKAVSRNRDCRLNVTSPTTYLIECEDPLWRPVEQIALPAGLVISSNARPEFHRRGNVSPMATITISNRNGREKRLVVNMAGRVRIE
jgi:hypothetical protein